MKTIVLTALVALFAPLYFYASPPDTTIKGIEVTFPYAREIFPGSWQPVNASGEAIAVSGISRSAVGVVKAPNKNPENILTNNLKAVYFLKTIINSQ